MTLSFFSAVRLSAGKSSMKGKLSAAFPGGKIVFGFYGVSDDPEHKIEVTPQKIIGVKNQVHLRTKAQNASAQVRSRTDAADWELFAK